MTEPVRVLVVDDEVSIRVTTVLGLVQAGFMAEGASDGHEALKMLGVLKPRIVLLDINLPGGLNGVKVCQRIKNNPGYEDTMVIMMTAVGDKKTIFDSIQAGAVDYIVKPFTAAVVMDKIKKAMAPPVLPVKANPSGRAVEEEVVSPKPKVRRGSGLASSRARMDGSAGGGPGGAQ